MGGTPVCGKTQKRDPGRATKDLSGKHSRLHTDGGELLDRRFGHRSAICKKEHPIVSKFLSGNLYDHCAGDYGSMGKRLDQLEKRSIQRS